MEKSGKKQPVRSKCNIVVVGGANIDYLIRSSHLPAIGETIKVGPGANGQVTKNDIFQAAPRLVDAKVILLQLEIPMEAVMASIGISN
jgi:hypothetical protein